MAHLPNGELVPVGGGDSIPLIRETLTVGRLESCDICLRLPNVSKTHCKFSFINGFWWLEDLGSTNGVKVNGTRITNRRVLHPDDIITLAKRTWRVQYDMPVGTQAMEEVLEDNPLSIPLLERAGLTRPRDKQPPPRSKPLSPPQKNRGNWMRVMDREEDD
jgi:pSer/pThr/pTyr-binding forkhead associated (FHA) protein